MKQHSKYSFKTFGWESLPLAYKSNSKADNCQKVIQEKGYSLL
jgi:hypothetical protein